MKVTRVSTHCELGCFHIALTIVFLIDCCVPSYVNVEQLQHVFNGENAIEVYNELLLGICKLC